MMNLTEGVSLQGGKYKIIKTLGQGSFGITYLAEHTYLGKRVAVKEFFMKELNSRGEDGSITGMSDSSLSYNYCQKFKKEAVNLSRLDHPNIVRVTDSFAENGTFYYVMDYIDGQNLNEYVKTHRISETEAVNIIKHVADALIYMHETHHMLHLDLKPGNIMRRDSDGHVFLIDFGLSKHYSDSGQPETSTTIGLGTAGYAPIEQATQAKNGEFRATIDVYALGATLYKLLTGETPPDASVLVSDNKLVENNLRAKGVSENILDTVVAAMKPSINERIQTIRDFQESLNGNLNKEDTVVAELVADPIPTSTTSVNDKDKAREDFDGANPGDKKKVPQKLVYAFAAVLIVGLCALGILSKNGEEQEIGPQPEQQEMSFSNGTLKCKGVTYEMAEVEAGTFTMGATLEMEDPLDDEVPVHQVTLTNDYYIGKTEVTQALWKAVMGDNPSYYKGDGRPVENVSWDDCQEFISKLNAATGKNFRLPTEAEWEFAARGGNKSNHYQYSGSDNIDDVAWYDGNSGDKTHDVASKQPNELGIYDMSGNVWEWCSDWYGGYSSKSQTNPKGPESGSNRVGRGGSWRSYAWCCRSSYRRRCSPDNRRGNLGLRLALPVQP